MVVSCTLNLLLSVNLEKTAKYLIQHATFHNFFFLNSCCPIVICNFVCVCSVQGFEIEGELPEKVASYEGVYYNYFSIGTLICTSVVLYWCLK